MRCDICGEGFDPEDRTTVLGFDGDYNTCPVCVGFLKERNEIKECASCDSVYFADDFDSCPECEAADA